jgi:hypothetical protein
MFTLLFVNKARLFEALDGDNLKFSCRRTVDAATIEQWYEVMQIASTILFSEEEDSII